MFRNLRNTIATLLTAFTLVFVPLAAPAAVFADNVDIQNNLCGGANLSLSTGDCAGTDTTGQLNDLIHKIVNIFSLVVGVVAVIMIVIGGFRYITSNGDSNNISSAKNTIMYAIIGLVIVALAQFIVQFVLNKAGTLAG